MIRVAAPGAVVASRAPIASSRFVGGNALDLKSLAKLDADHAPVLFSMGVGKPKVDVLSWNVCFRYKTSERYGVNNGFGRTDEGVDAYRARLVRTAAKVEAMVRASKKPVVFLQEAPRAGDPGHGLLEQELGRRLGKDGYRVFSSGDRVTLVQGGASALSLPDDLLQRQGAALDAFLLDQPKTVVVNVHLAWDARGSAEERETKEDLRALVEHLRAAHPGVPIVIAGDTNRVPGALVAANETSSRVEEVFAGVGHIVAPPGPTNLRFDAAKNAPVLTWADFAIFCPPAAS